MGKDQELLDAARSGNIGQVARLLDQIAKRSSGPLSSFRRCPNINSQDTNGYTPLHHACLNGHIAIVRLLLAHDALIDLPDIRGSTPLYLASWAGHEDIVRMLLTHSRSANPNAQTVDNETPLHCAAQHGHNSALSILLSYGADPSVRNNSFQTALDLAAHFGRFDAVKILLRTHPELIEPYKAATATSFDLTNYLPENFTATSPTKHIFTHTCLHLASRNGHKKVVEVLLAAGVNVNILTHAGSALHEAALCGKTSVASTLLEAGINPHAQDGNGRTALDLLKDYPPQVTYEILTVIKDFCKKCENKCQLQPTSSSDEEFSRTEFITTTENDIREKAHSIPKSACIKKLNKSNQIQKAINGNSGLSSSLNSLEKFNKGSENYLQMKPIIAAKSSMKQRSDYENFSPISSKVINTTDLEEKGYPQSQHLELRTTEKRNLIDACKKRYYCVDEYVMMTDPRKRTSNSSNTHNINTDGLTQKNDFVDYNDDTKSSSLLHLKDLKKLDANNNKRHSPTPDFPPPSVVEAESTILEFMHPPRPISKKSTKRRSIHIEYTENIDDNDDLETFVMKHIHLDNISGDETNVSSFQPRASTPATSSRASEQVEEFVSEFPFAGLFKGSTLNLAADEIDGFMPSATGLRSPSLVRSVKPPAVKQVLPASQTSINANKEEEFNATKVWEEINTILESIGNEMLNEEENENFLEVLPEVTNEMVLKERSRNLVMPKPIKIRNPSELLLGMKSNGSAKWCHSSNMLINGEVTYEVYYLGSTVIRELKGTISTRKSIQKLKRDEVFIENEQDSNILENCTTSTKYLKAANEQSRLQVGIAVSYAGVQFIDTKEKNTICVHDIQNIHCVCQDAEDLRYFAYITKEQELHYCHVFMVDQLDLATEIILTLGQAFEVAYQLALVKDQHENKPINN